MAVVTLNIHHRGVRGNGDVVLDRLHPTTGTVRDGAGAPIANAWVHYGVSDSQYALTSTDGEGAFTVLAPADGELRLDVRADGFAGPERRTLSPPLARAAARALESRRRWPQPARAPSCPQRCRPRPPPRGAP